MVKYILVKSMQIMHTLLDKCQKDTGYSCHLRVLLNILLDIYFF